MPFTPAHKRSCRSTAIIRRINKERQAISAADAEADVSHHHKVIEDCNRKLKKLGLPAR